MMTNRQALNAIITAEVSEELTEWATKELAKMDKENARRASKPTKAQIENGPILKAMEEILVGADEGLLASQLGEQLGITTQKASALARQLVANEVAVATEVSVKGKGKQKSYTIKVSEEKEGD